MTLTAADKQAMEKLSQLSYSKGLNVQGGKVRRSSSRFCLGVEHGDYNGTELFGVGTDRFIWMAYKPNGTPKCRLYSDNFPGDGVIEFELGKVPGPKSPQLADSWGRFPCGADYVLHRHGYRLTAGIDAVLYGNIPGGGMSRSASLSLNLITSLLDASNLKAAEPMKVVDMAQQVENEYIGSPCGVLDQVMIMFARAGMGTHYNPADRSIKYVPLGAGADFRLVVMDTGTTRHGLEKSTYAIRRKECDDLAAFLGQEGYPVKHLADVRDEAMFHDIMGRYIRRHTEPCQRLKYIFNAQKRFYQMLEAWKRGDIVTVGAIFRADGLGLRDDYVISGPELEAMCNIARGVKGVLGERMLGGGDKGASGALIQAEAVEPLQKAVAEMYPKQYPAYAGKFAVHALSVVDGISLIEGHI